MKDVGPLVHLLRNTSVRELTKALERDGFVLERSSRTGGHIYRHPDGRLALLHYHRGSDILTRRTLRTFLQSTGWAKEDLRRLKLRK